MRYAHLPLVAALALLGACSAEPETQAPPVASLIQPSASASASPEPERPRQRLDDTEEDYRARLKPYEACMRKQGMPGGKMGSGWAAGDDVPPKQKRAQEACKQFWPLPAWELDPANPEAKDFARDVVKCLKGKGVEYVETAEDGIGISAGGDQNDEESITKTGQYLDECQRTVAARK
ncbi:MAG: hypothetical protein ABW000_09685 [Actinoplanes sp.]